MKSCNHKFEKIAGTDTTFLFYKCKKCGKLESNDPTMSEEYLKYWERENKIKALEIKQRLEPKV